MYVSLRGAAGGELRTATFEGREHIVVPVVALVEGVIHASNSTNPELVLAEEFAKVPDGWNGRPVTWDHPNLNGQQVSANEPLVLEKMAIGRVFHTKVEDKKLKVEAWIDAERTPSTERALESIARIKAGEVVEVSVGAYVQTEEKSGEWDGKKYAAVWRDIVPDHLAFLPEGTTGACSVEMGCGAPRAAEEKKMTLMEKLTEKLKEMREGFKASQEISDSDLRDALWGALNAVEPGFLGVDAVFPDSSEVVYAVAPEEKLMLFRRGYTSENGSVTLADDKEEVHVVTQYEPVAASADAGSGGTKDLPAENTDMEKKERVAAIIASGKTCFVDADASVLEQLSDDRITALEERVKVASTPEPKPEPKTEPKPEVKKTPEEEQTEFLAKHPDIAQIVTEHKAAAVAKREGLVTTLKAAQKTFSEDELNKMDVVQLEKLVALAGEKKDFSGQTPRNASDDDDAAPAPIDMGERIRAMRSA